MTTPAKPKPRPAPAPPEVYRRRPAALSRVAVAPEPDQVEKTSLERVPRAPTAEDKTP